MDNFGDYISRDDGKVAAWEILESMGYSSKHNDRLVEEVDAVFDEIPAADVRSVVLCKDCKHSDTFAPDCTDATFPLKCVSIRYGGVYPNWFCEHGEKREES